MFFMFFVFYMCCFFLSFFFFFFFQAEDGIRDHCVTGVQTCALPISLPVRLGAANQVRRLALRLLADRVAFLARFLDDARRRGMRPALELREPTATDRKSVV